MQFLNNTKVVLKMVLLQTVILGILALAVGLTVAQLKALNDEAETMYSNNLLGLRWTKDANIQLSNLSRGVWKLALVRPEMRPGYIKAYHESVARAREDLNKVSPLLLTTEGLALHAKASAALEAVLPKLADIIKNIPARDATQTLEALVETRNYATAADSSMAELGAYMAHVAEVRSAQVSELAGRSYAICLGAILVALLVGAVLGLLIKLALANPLMEISRKATLAADDGLGQEFFRKRKNELSALATALQQMSEKLSIRIAEMTKKSLEAEEQWQIARKAMLEAAADQEQPAVNADNAGSLDEINVMVDKSSAMRELAEGAPELRRQVLKSKDLSCRLRNWDAWEQ